MGNKECWNCGAEIGATANYCSQCVHPVDAVHVYLKVQALEKERSNILENATKLYIHGMMEYFSEEQFKSIMRQAIEESEGDSDVDERIKKLL